jgi:hypothetical protein
MRHSRAAKRTRLAFQDLTGNASRTAISGAPAEAQVNKIGKRRCGPALADSSSEAMAVAKTASF